MGSKGMKLTPEMKKALDVVRTKMEESGFLDKDPREMTDEELFGVIMGFWDSIRLAYNAMFKAISQLIENVMTDVMDNGKIEGTALERIWMEYSTNDPFWVEKEVDDDPISPEEEHQNELADLNQGEDDGE